MEEQNSEQIKMLYKYRYFDSNHYHINTILNNEFYFASKDELNDPYDLSLKRNFENYNLQELKYLTDKNLKNSEKILEDLPQIFLEKNIRTEEEKKEYLIKELNQSVINSVEILGICSFSANIWNNILMWSHYCDSHKGFCIGLNYDKINKHLGKLNSNEKVLIHPFIVEYGQDFNKKFKNHVYEPFLNILNYKYSTWEYEKEIRIINTNENKFTMKVPEEVIEEIILGLYISDENKQIVINALKLKSNKPKLYQIKQKDNSFDFEREEIEYLK